MIWLKTNQAFVIPVAVLAVAVFGLGGWFLFNSKPQFAYQAAMVATTSLAVSNLPPPVIHLPTPKPVKGVYMTACVAGTPSLRMKLVKLIEDTELNSIIIDLKDYSGTISFSSDNPKLEGTKAGGCTIKDLGDFIRELHAKKIYVIGRITVFQDPFYAKHHPELAVKRASDGGVWKDRKGISYIDVSAKPYWDYIVEISKEAHALGVDELNFDYVRFPSDGNMQDIAFPFSGSRAKADALVNFFAYLDQALKPLNVPTSADLFGMTTTAELGSDLNIGQDFIRALPYFDYLAPMVYPSHYPPHFYGYANPNAVPYEIIKIAMDGAVAKTLAASSTAAQVRPWLQDFDYGGNYDVPQVKAQIKATYDAGVKSWMIWDPANVYTRAAYEPAL